VERDVLEPDRPQLLHEHAREVELARCARAAGAVTRGLGVDAHVAEEALEHVVGERLGKRRGEGHRQSTTAAGAGARDGARSAGSTNRATSAPAIAKPAPISKARW